MKEVFDWFNGLFFSECVLGAAKVQGQTLSIPVSRLFVLGRHPLANERHDPYDGKLVFDGDIDPHRKFTE